jgi:predicted hydrolase (HD superfamily)
MEITVPMTSQEYDCLSSHTSKASPANHALMTAAVLSHTDAAGIYQDYEITCGDIEAQALFAVAQLHCSSALSKIADAIKRAKGQ